MEDIINIERKIIYDVYLSYSHKDREFAGMIADALRCEGVSVCYDEAVLLPTDDFYQQLVEAISSAKAFLPLITHNYANSPHCMNELVFALDKARDRAKLILPVCTSQTVLSESLELEYLLGIFHCISANRETYSEAKRIAEQLSGPILAQKAENTFYSKLSEYVQAGANKRASELICDYVTEFCEKIKKSTYTESKKLFAELFSLLHKLDDLYDYDYGENARELGQKKLNVASDISKLSKLPIFESDDLYFIATAIRLIYFDRELRYAGIDALTHGDLSDGIIHAVPESEYAEKQHPYLERFEAEYEAQNIKSGETDRYSAEELEYINSTEKYVYVIYSSNIGTAKNAAKNARGQEVTPDDELLCSVASFMRESNKLFDIIGETNFASEFIRCLIVSYERLKAYCEVIGEKEICAECIDRIFELKGKLDSVNTEEDISPKANNGIKTLLGFTQPKSGKFDVFISHKSDDVDIAEDLYYFMKRNMKEAFYDKESLPEMSESQYRKAIMQALDGSAHFVVLFSDLSFLESYWVKLEMEIFQSEIDEGRKKNSNFIMIVTNNIYEQIMASNKSVLPIDFRRCEIMRVEEYKSKLLSYIN